MAIHGSSSGGAISFRFEVLCVDCWAVVKSLKHSMREFFFYIVFLGLISFLFFGYWFYNLLELVLSMMHELRCRKSLPECGLEAVP